MNALTGIRDPFGLVLAAAAAVTLFAFQEGPLVAIVAAVSVLAVRTAAAPLLERVQRKPLLPPAPAPPPSGQPWYHPLTKRESEVALLVTEGLTNPEIAHRLLSERTVDGHVTEKTVDTHVQNIMNKLSKELGREVNRRAQISAWVTERRPRDPVIKAQPPR